MVVFAFTFTEILARWMSVSSGEVPHTIYKHERHRTEVNCQSWV